MNFLAPILTGKASLIARIIMITLAILTIFLIHQIDSNYNYHKGYNKSIMDHPQTLITGNNNVIDQRIRKMACFPLHIGNIGFGICHE